MKKTAIIVMVLAAVGIANAALVNNGGFDVSAIDWVAIGGGGTWLVTHSTTGGNPDGNVTMTSGDNVWNVWYQSFTENLNVWGIPAGSTITFQVDIKEIGNGVIFNSAGLKAESWVIGGAAALSDSGDQLFTVTNNWATYSYNYTLNPAANAFKFVLLDVNYGKGGIASYAYDNARISFPGGATPALFPIPTVGNNGVATANDVLSWTNPAPYNPSESILCDVWFRSSATPLSDPNLVASQPGAVQIVDGEAISSLDLSTKEITLVADRYYYWKVNVIDPNNGFPKQTDGFTWSFFTGDAAPTDLNAGTDQYVWLTDGTKTFTLSGSYTDDAKSAVTTTWTLNPLTQTDPATITTIATPSVAQGSKTSGTHATTVTVNNTGWFFFDFTATDSAGAAIDTVNVGVYVNACEAANQDPADMPTKYPNGHGDIDGDCDVDMADFAVMAASWLDCMSTKLDCI